MKSNLESYFQIRLFLFSSISYWSAISSSFVLFSWVMVIYEALKLKLVALYDENGNNIYDHTNLFFTE
ncbi:hypothetical protein DWB61_06035 [Ancylomarina euxinus]|uniref:Uncharacterized protein n=1 Tax=Ancylomarina euxinus TaxID=2283627 RepID=A0A425Y404_9BACT|nr:hypothetical protein DWB61_06035 [Ancylomarina euxinus]